ncbi:MAG: electron transport complex subunit RsxC [Bacillota bacterium]
MSVRSFQAGIHPPQFKEATSGKEVVDIALPEEVVIPLWQHVGAPCDPLVKVGDRVLAGQKIGDSDAFVSAPVHASVAGEVTAIEPRPSFDGTEVNSVVISVAEKQESVEFPPGKGVDEATPEDIKKAAREAGIVGMGGAAFPTSVKLSPPPDKPIDSLIINGGECEPFLTCDHRGMLEETDELIQGTRLLMKAVGASRGYFGIEDNKPDAIELLTEKVSGIEDMEVVPLVAKYPQGAEKQLIKAVLDREVPPGALPMEVGALVHNVNTALAIYQAVTGGIPLIERVVTVSGPCVTEPKNVRAKVGTPVRHILEQCEGTEGAAKVILGGPMTGFAQSSLGVPIVKGTGGILALPPEMVEDEEWLPCVRCGKCVEACPMFLYPNFIGTYAEAGEYDQADAWGVLDCMECGICAYVCPSKRPLIQFVRSAKADIMARRN